MVILHRLIRLLASLHRQSPLVAAVRIPRQAVAPVVVVAAVPSDLTLLLTPAALQVAPVAAVDPRDLGRDPVLVLVRATVDDANHGIDRLHHGHDRRETDSAGFDRRVVQARIPR